MLVSVSYRGVTFYIVESRASACFSHHETASHHAERWPPNLAQVNHHQGCILSSTPQGFFSQL